MDRAFYTGNREKLASQLKPGTLALFFSGEEIRKTNDEYYPFFADRNFVYLTGIEQKQSVLLIMKDGNRVTERLYLLPGDPMAERWTGRRLKEAEAEAISGVADIRSTDSFLRELHALAVSGKFGFLALDLYRVSPEDIDRPAHRLHALAAREWPYLAIQNANTILRALRTIKQPCEIAALRRAERITGEGILAMMKASQPGTSISTRRSLTGYWVSTTPRGRAFPPSFPPGGTISASTIILIPVRPWTAIWYSTMWVPSGTT